MTVAKKFVVRGATELSMIALDLENAEQALALA
jgi:hypothetical protein